MTIRHASQVLIPRWVLLLLLVVTACDVAAPPAEPALTVRFVQARDADGDILDVRELAEFEVAALQLLPADSAFVREFSLEGYLSSSGIGGSQSGSTADIKEDVVFWFVTEDETQKVVSSGLWRRLSNFPKPNSSTTSSFKGAGMFEGRFHAFSIEGVGEPSTVPIQMSLRGASEEYAFEYLPERHVLPARVLLHVDDSMLQPYLPEEEAPLLKIEVEADAFDLDDYVLMIAKLHSVPAYGTVNGQPVEGRMMIWDGRSLSEDLFLSRDGANKRQITYVGLPEAASFYLVALER